MVIVLECYLYLRPFLVKIELKQVLGVQALAVVAPDSSEILLQHINEVSPSITLSEDSVLVTRADGKDEMHFDFTQR